MKLSRTTLRRRVETLEARMGVSLLYRGAQGAHLTEAGILLAERGKKILQETTLLLNTIREMGDEPAGHLRVALPVGMPPHVMVPIFAAPRHSRYTYFMVPSKSRTYSSNRTTQRCAFPSFLYHSISELQ